MLPMHATPRDPPPPLTPARLLTAWTWDWWIFTCVLVTASLYVFGVAVLHRRAVRWPLGRTVAFLVGGLGSAVIATMSAIGTYDTVLFSMHTVQHMILMMATPLFLALGAPVTLALRTLPAQPRSILLTVLHARLVKVVTFPPLVFALFVATPFALYYSSFYEASLRSGFWHNFVHLHFVMIGSLLMWPLLGIDPVPGRVGYPFRVLTMFLLLPFHAFLGVSIMSSDALIAEEWYLSFNRSWPPSPIDDQYLAGGIMWGSGDIVAVIMLAVLFVQWFRASQREAVREDRRLDRLDARQARYDARQARYDAGASREPEASPHVRDGHR
ncbi:MAG: cytochrome c oxidase assembly protein [Propionibacteriaceae bacterium]|nr:cytochrome c oxidase assembly protein [Propionibacteriaceae bacterium]